MLEFLRKSASGIIVKVLLGLLILSFAAWGIGDVFSSKAGRVAVAVIGDNEISPEEFSSELGREVERLKPVLGQTFTPEQAKLFGIGDALLNRLVNTQLYDLGAKDLGLGISDAVVLAEIKRSPEFFDEDDKFDRNRFVQLLQGAGFSEESYVARVRHNMARLQYLLPIRAGVEVPPLLAKLVQAYNGEKRILEMVRVDHASIENFGKPNDDELRKFHKENSRLFMAPEYRKFRTIILKAEDVAKNIEISEADLKSAYDERVDEFISPERRKLKQILVDNEASAKIASDLIAKGGSVADAAAKSGADPDLLDIGFFSQDQLLPEIQDVVFSIEAGSATGPIKTVLGWHVVFVEKIEKSEQKSFSKAKETIATELKTERALDTIFEMSSALEDELASGTLLEETARNLGLEAITSESDSSGKMIGGKKLSIPFADEIISTVFVLESGGDTPLVEAKDESGFFVSRLIEVTPPTLKKYETVKQAVLNARNLEASAARAKEITDKIIEKVKSGSNISTAAKEVGMKVETTPAFDRNGAGLALGIPAEMVGRAFELSPGDAATAQGTSSSVAVVLKEILKADENDKAALDKTTAKIFEELRGDILDQLAASLRQRHSVTINRNVLDQAY
ncbi:MAG: SurA N-terminal domain-containing protein [Rhodospirillaceae bacterium]|nr:SurA N-terminal domain-containing protein [Rhodospirillaceae bacterium]